jgi:hypothetical protein
MKHSSPTLLIPHIWLPLIEKEGGSETEQYLRSAFCSKDNIEWFYLVKIQRGFSDFEEISCKCCKSSLYRGENVPSGFSASELEVVAWLTADQRKSKTLIMGFTQYSTEQIKNSLLCHLQTLNFSDLFTAMDVMEGGMSFLNTKKQSVRKLISTFSLLRTIALKKQSAKRKDKLMPLSEGSLGKAIEASQEESIRNMRLSESAKEVLRLFQEVDQNSLKTFKKFRKNKKAYKSLFQTKNFLNEASSLTKLCYTSTEKDLAIRSLSTLGNLEQDFAMCLVEERKIRHKQKKELNRGLISSETNSKLMKRSQSHGM